MAGEVLRQSETSDDGPFLSANSISVVADVSRDSEACKESASSLIISRLPKSNPAKLLNSCAPDLCH